MSRRDRERPRAGPHDIGGFRAGPVDPVDHERERWQQRTEAMVNIARAAGFGSLDELRRHIESLEDRYAGTGYYERMLEALAAMLVERGVLDLAELERRMER